MVLLVALMACGDSDPTPKAEEPTTASATEEAGPEHTPELGSPVTDREILVAIYNALDGPSWTDSENWLSDVPLGDWSGVGTYDNGRVNSLQLRVQGLRGEIPPELANINPSVLILSNNQLSGEITLAFSALWPRGNWTSATTS